MTNDDKRKLLEKFANLTIKQDETGLSMWMEVDGQSYGVTIPPEHVEMWGKDPQYGLVESACKTILWGISGFGPASLAIRPLLLAEWRLSAAIQDRSYEMSESYWEARAHVIEKGVSNCIPDDLMPHELAGSIAKVKEEA